MSDSSDAVLAYWTEHREQLRQSENQRSVATNFLLVIVTALSGLIVQQRLEARTLPLAVLIVVLGFYGTAISAKYYERAQYHLKQARALTSTLKAMGVLVENQELAASREAHYRSHPLMRRVRLHWLWTGLHLAISAYGLVLAVIIAV